MSFPFPSDFPVEEGRVLASRLRGQPDNFENLHHATWAVYGYAAGQVAAAGHPTVNATSSTACTAEEAARHLEDCCVAAAGGAHHKLQAAAIPWKAMLSLFLNMLQQFMQQSAPVA